MYLPFIRRGEGQPPHYTPEDEERIINEQIRKSQVLVILEILFNLEFFFIFSVIGILIFLLF